MAKSKKTIKKTTRKVSTKKTPVKKSTNKRMDGYFSNDLSFKAVKDPMPFMSVRVTQQTMIWTLLLIFIMIVQVWILYIQLDVANIITNK